MASAEIASEAGASSSSRTAGGSVELGWADRILRRMATGREGVSPVSGSGLPAAQVSMISMSGAYRRTVVLLTAGTATFARGTVVPVVACREGKGPESASLIAHLLPHPRRARLAPACSRIPLSPDASRATSETPGRTLRHPSIPGTRQSDVVLAPSVVHRIAECLEVSPSPVDVVQDFGGLVL